MIIRHHDRSHRRQKRPQVHPDTTGGGWMGGGVGGRGEVDKIGPIVAGTQSGDFGYSRVGRLGQKHQKSDWVYVSVMTRLAT
mmetsp:Transcript_8224/g.16753  ORF Transcript_8224/g.16753 Transcript_8224/m.16753 type:complete len:82 (-) Transcript_8224:199-444(-)